jgi:hypothetical protein
MMMKGSFIYSLLIHPLCGCAGGLAPGPEQPQVPDDAEGPMCGHGRCQAQGHPAHDAQDPQPHPHDLGQLRVLQDTREAHWDPSQGRLPLLLKNIILSHECNTSMVSVLYIIWGNYIETGSRACSSLQIGSGLFQILGQMELIILDFSSSLRARR